MSYAARNFNKHYRQNQEMKVLLFLAGIVIVALLIILHGYHTELRMERYARKNNCEWVYHGTFYGDNRDQTCVKK